MLGSVHGWKGKVLEENKAQWAETQIWLQGLSLSLLHAHEMVLDFKLRKFIGTDSGAGSLLLILLFFLWLENNNKLDIKEDHVRHCLA